MFVEFGNQTGITQLLTSIIQTPMKKGKVSTSTPYFIQLLVVEIHDIFSSYIIVKTDH
jgi:hypothetical protein